MMRGIALLLCGAAYCSAANPTEGAPTMGDCTNHLCPPEMTPKDPAPMCAAATCTDNECCDPTGCGQCAAAGQNCVNPTGMVGDWACECPPPSFGFQWRGVANCSAVDECASHGHVCTDVGQGCEDTGEGFFCFCFHTGEMNRGGPVAGCPVTPQPPVAACASLDQATCHSSIRCVWNGACIDNPDNVFDKYGCLCEKSWSIACPGCSGPGSSQTDPCVTGCCNPDSDPHGSWCMIDYRDLHTSENPACWGHGYDHGRCDADEPVHPTPSPAVTRATPSPDTPAVTPSPDTPAVTPSPDTPAVTPSPDTPAVTPSPDTPAVTPSPDTPAVTPSPDTPAVTPSPAVTRATPSPDTPAVTPSPGSATPSPFGPGTPVPSHAAPEGDGAFTTTIVLGVVGGVLLLCLCGGAAFYMTRRAKATEGYVAEQSVDVNAMLDAEMALTKEQYREADASTPTSTA